MSVSRVSSEGSLERASERETGEERWSSFRADKLRKLGKLLLRRGRFSSLPSDE